MPNRTTTDLSHLRLAAILVESLVVFGAVGAANGEMAFHCLQVLNVAMAIGVLLYRSAHACEPPATTFVCKPRFSIRTTLAATAVCCGFFAAARSHDPEFGVLLLFWLSSIALLSAALWGQTAGVLALLVYHLFLNALLLAGPIASYHINGRAWYDYGLSGWNPPLAVDEQGNTFHSDYDPKFTPPASWPIVGGVLHAMCVFSIGIVVCPPVAPLVALTSGILFLRYRRFNTRQQRRLACALWSAALCPLLYLIVWGDKVLSWIAD